MDNNLQIKSPIFTPKPGWGGKLEKWLNKNFNSKIFPILSILVLIIGLYGFFNNRSKVIKKESNTESEVIEKIVQPRQGLTHLARAALSEFIKSKGVELLPEQKLFAETYLVTKLNNRMVHAGDTISFHINDLSETIEKAQLLNDYQLQEWSKYLK